MSKLKGIADYLNHNKSKKGHHHDRSHGLDTMSQIYPMEDVSVREHNEGPYATQGRRRDSAALNCDGKSDNSRNSKEHTGRLSKRKVNDIEENTAASAGTPPPSSGEYDTAEVQSKDDFVDVAPDGGLAAWLVLFGSFCGSITVFGTMDAMGAIEAYLSTHQLSEQSASTVGWIFSIFIIVSFEFIFVTGEIFDKIGARIPMIVGSCLMFVGLMTTAECTSVYQFILAFSITCGLACAIMLAPLVGIIPQYFDRKIGLASALVSTGGSVGGSVFPVVLRKLYTSIGWVWAMRIFAFINLGLLVIACVFVRARIEPVVSEEYRRKPLSGKLAECLTNSLDFSAFKDTQFLLVTLATLFSEVTTVIVVTYFASYAVSKHASENTAYFLLTLLNIVGIPGRWATGVLSDRFGKFNVMIIMVLFSAVFLIVVLVPFSHHIAALYVFTVMFGISSCSVFTLTPVCLAQITRVDMFGKRYGTMYTVASAGNLLIPAAGAIIGSHSSSSGFDNYIIFSGVLSFVGACLWLAARYCGVKAKATVY